MVSQHLSPLTAGHKASSAEVRCAEFDRNPGRFVIDRAENFDLHQDFTTGAIGKQHIQSGPTNIVGMLNELSHGFEIVAGVASVQYLIYGYRNPLGAELALLIVRLRTNCGSEKSVNFVGYPISAVHRPEISRRFASKIGLVGLLVHTFGIPFLYYIKRKISNVSINIRYEFHAVPDFDTSNGPSKLTFRIEGQRHWIHTIPHPRGTVAAVICGFSARF